jgi:dihydrofolate reductase
MRKLVMKMSMSLDGFVGGPKGENDWIFASSSEDSKAWVLDLIRGAGLIVMGRRSFEEMSPYWPTAGGPFAAPMNEIPKGVFTRMGFQVPPAKSSDSATASWAKAQVFSGDLAEEIRRLKQEPGKPILAIGGAGFMRSLIATGLIDEYHLPVHPVALGSGMAIFSHLAKPLDLELISATSFSGGIVAHSYHPIPES